MAALSQAPDQAWSRRERPWLIPSNRKLRHLHAITLRNLAFNPDISRPPRYTIDDDALPTTLKSPAKILALRENNQLSHSRSQDNLRPIHENAIDSSPSPSEKSGNAISNSANVSPERVKSKTPSRPSFAKMRRRSTLEWASASSFQRQKKLEDVSASRMADVFFSIHVPGIEDPIYISEIVEKAMNPNFNHIDLDGAASAVTRLDTLTVKFWIKPERQPNYSLLLDLTLNLRSLQFLGKSLASFHHPFPPNCVIFQMTDGFYTAFTDIRVDESANPFSGFSTKETRSPLPTSSFDALLRLSKLDDSVQDALALRNRLATDLDGAIQQNHLASPEKDNVAQAEDYVKTIDLACTTVRKQVKTLQTRIAEKRKTLQIRRDLLARERENQIILTEIMKAEREEMSNQTEEKLILQKSVAAQRRRISTDVSKIYPITPVPEKPLAFSIRGIHLPNSEDLDVSKSTPESIAAALGHVSHVLQLLSFYWGVIIPYRLQSRSSSSSIVDNISNLASTNPAGASSTSSPFAGAAGVNEKLLRTFPLFSKGAVRFRFEYGLFLLNKDIQLLLEMGWGVKVMDIRQSLPNLCLALYCATAGEGQLPARKAGGIRGLARVGQDEDERRASQDSTTVVGSDGGFDGGMISFREGAAFESLKRVGKGRRH